jgi:phenylalanine-4-hydroxylase
MFSASKCNGCGIISHRRHKSLSVRSFGLFTAQYPHLAPDGVRIYGADIVPSNGETLKPAPNRPGSDLERVMRTRARAQRSAARSHL